MTQETALDPTSVPHRRRWSRLALAALGLAALVAVVAVLAGFGSRWGLWHFRTGFTLLRWAAYGGLAAIVLGAAAMFRARPGGPRHGFAIAFLAVVLGLLTVGIPWQARRAGAGAPPIHDITTDTENPPDFVAVAPLRVDDPNPVDYEGADVARQQRGAYPDIRPLILDLPADQAFDRALDAVIARGWELVDAVRAEGRIEATDRTFWFGFRDDVVVRLTPLDANRTVVDVRSKSRVGRGDLGTNARRVRQYLRALGS
jgi:uncharacterized protein (DUF1499 family)